MKNQNVNLDIEKSLYKEALNLIHNSSSIDFKSCLEWGQWCRDVATTALMKDVDKLNLLRIEHKNYYSDIPHKCSYREDSTVCEICGS